MTWTQLVETVVLPGLAAVIPVAFGVAGAWLMLQRANYERKRAEAEGYRAKSERLDLMDKAGEFAAKAVEQMAKKRPMSSAEKHAEGYTITDALTPKDAKEVELDAALRKNVKELNEPKAESAVSEQKNPAV